MEFDILNIEACRMHQIAVPLRNLKRIFQIAPAIYI